MEALHSRLTTGEQSGGQEHRQPESQSRGPLPRSPSQPRRQQRTSSPKPHGTLRQARQSKRQHPERKRLRRQRQSVDSESASENKPEAAAKATTVSSLPPGAPSSSAGGPTQNKAATQEGTPKQKRERKPQTPGKYVCTYCGRACAKPSVLQKHIRSHTGERPYPCTPCGFSFKTKSNLYKHRKSHTHRVKAGLALGEPRSLEEQVTESEDETRQSSSAPSLPERQSNAASMKRCETDRAKDGAGGSSDSYAVKKRLALRLSRGTRGPQGSSDEKASSFILGSKGSTESGYFSRSESTELPQDSPQDTSAKSYAEIILGKYGRLGLLQRTPRRHDQQPSAQEDEGVPFTVPKKQVIEHITKLISINEAVVDTSEIDSVKPRRFSLSRKNSSESQKSPSVKEQLVHSPKTADVGYKSSGSITMGVPCEKFHHPSLNVEQLAGQTSAALVRSHSVPTAASSFDRGPGKFHQSQSFDERKPSERQASRRYGMLRRQPAIEIPLGAELAKEERDGSRSFYPDSLTTTPDHKPSPPQLYECEACGTGCKDWEGYKRHRQSLCPVHYPKNETAMSQIECSRLSHHSVRAGALTMRKRRKEESFEVDEPSSPSSPSPVPVSGQCKGDSNAVYEGPRRPALQTCSVIQHTSSFERQESLCNENQGPEATKTSPPHDEHQRLPHRQHQQESTRFGRRLVRQPNVLVPEILVTEDSNTSTGTSLEPAPKAKHSERSDEFQWPQRSSSLSQLPIEKLPPKKKRLRLAEAAQSSGESSFDSVSLSRSPSRDSSASYASSRSTSFEESNRPDTELATLTPLRKSRASDMLTVPGVHQHREMRRSASEQAPHDPQPSVAVAETRSKSFDYSCLSPERTAAGWKERRKCLLMRHTAVRDPDEEEEVQRSLPGRSPEHVSPRVSSQESPPSACCGRSAASPPSGDTVVSTPVRLQRKEIFTQWNLSQSIQLSGTTEPPLTHRVSAEPEKEEASQIHARPPPQAPHSYPAHGPSGAARARYLPMSTGLKLEIPSLHGDYSEAPVSHSHLQHPVPHITTSQELLRPVASPAVAVRLQADTVTLGCAIYTTLSQGTSPPPEVKLDVVSQNIPPAECGDRGNINLQLWPDDDLRISGSGGSKRVLSPSNSIEIPAESQQQQKRVKEEEEREAGCVDKAFVVTCGQEVQGENRSCLPVVCSPSKRPGSSFPSLLSSTCHSWCYLNYLKPSPSPLDEQKPSVYSAWSTSGYDPNPPGLSSKTALALLHCKQRLSPSIYTLSAMTVRTADSEEDQRRPCSSEVCYSRSDRRDGEDSRAGQQSADDDGLNRKEEREEVEKEEEAESCSRENQPAEVWVFERRSNERCGGGGGKGRFQPELPRRVCKAKAEGNLRSQGTGSCCHPAGATDQDREAEAADGGGEGEEARSEEASRSKASEGSNGAACGGEKSQPIEPRRSREPAPRGSASLRRALFARRRLDASVYVPPGDSQSLDTPPPFTQRALSPPSPRPCPLPVAPRSLSPSSGDVPTSSLKPVSYVGGLSPGAVRSGCESSKPPASLAGTSAQCPARLHPGDQLLTARPSTGQVGLSPVGPHPTRPRGANLLSHLPLHSQLPSSRAPSLLIPIGGIHMVQPRSLLPLYSLVHSPAGMPTAAEANPEAANANPAAAKANPAAAKANPACAPRRLRDSPLLHQDSLKETLPSCPPSSPCCNPRPPDRGAFSGGQSEAPLDRKSSSVHQPSRTETRRLEVNADTPVPERCAHPETI